MNFLFGLVLLLFFFSGIATFFEIGFMEWIKIKILKYVKILKILEVFYIFLMVSLIPFEKYIEYGFYCISILFTILYFGILSYNFHRKEISKKRFYNLLFILFH